MSLTCFSSATAITTGSMAAELMSLCIASRYRLSEKVAIKDNHCAITHSLTRPHVHITQCVLQNVHDAFDAVRHVNLRVLQLANLDHQLLHRALLSYNE